MKFLQGYCTNDLARLAEGESCEAFFTEVKARVLAYGWVLRLADRCVVLLSSDRAPRLAEHLDRYVLRDDVTLATPDWRFAMAWGVDGTSHRVPVPAFGEAAAVLADESLPDLAAGGRRELSSEEFEALRVRLGVPRDGVDVDERNLPQEVDRNDRAISFTKGCYLGQEPVARIDALGRVNWLLRGLRFSSLDGVRRDVELTADGKPIGRVTSTAATDEGAIGLGYVRREHAEPGRVLSCGGSGCRRGGVSYSPELSRSGGRARCSVVRPAPPAPSIAVAVAFL